MATDKPESGSGKGFAGLSDMASELSDAELTQLAHDEAARYAPVKVLPAIAPTSEPEKSAQRQVDMPRGNEPIPLMAKWLAGLVGLMIIFGIINSTNKKVEVSTTYNQPNPSYNTPQSTSTPAMLEPLYEVIPPVGSGQLLNFLQLRFCLGEKIRLDALEVFGRNNVKRYNANVKFYNDRCSSYRYKVTDFNSVTQDTQDRKDLLAQQARLKWFKADELEAKSLGEPAKQNPPDPFKVFGADASTPTPKPTLPPSPHTPKSNGMPVNAKLDFTGTGWVCMHGYRQNGNICTHIKLPPNAVIDFTGNDWTCRQGYRQAGQECATVQIPANGTLDFIGSDWTCKRGFRQRGNECIAVDIPQNAGLDYLGNDWTCKRGYRQSSNSCVAVQLPPHASLDYLGNDWTCNPGYRQTGTFCSPN